MQEMAQCDDLALEWHHHYRANHSFPGQKAGFGQCRGVFGGSTAEMVFYTGVRERVQHVQVIINDPSTTEARRDLRSVMAVLS